MPEVDLNKKLGLSIISEGVEDLDDWVFTSSHGIMTGKPCKVMIFIKKPAILI